MGLERGQGDPEDRDHHHGGDGDNKGITDAGVEGLFLFV